MAALVNIQSGNPGGKLQRGSFRGFPGYYGSKQGSVWSLRYRVLIRVGGLHKKALHWFSPGITQTPNLTTP